ncbi:MAG: hypothetical protein LQ349_001094 [Xanthoria aureola]|nr:MAG: hypothetical protein LQ349_001094 [Xanthoria aureola]
MPTSTTPKLSNKSTTPAPHALAKGLPAKDTELITRHIAKTMPKPAGSETPNGSSVLAPQALTKGVPHVKPEAIDGNVAKAGSAVAECVVSSGSTERDPTTPSEALQSSGTASGPSPDIKALLDGQRADIDRIAAIVDCFRHDLKILTAGVHYLLSQAKISTEPKTAPSLTAPTENVYVLTPEQQLLTENLRKLRTKPTEAEELKGELELLKQRVQYIERLYAASLTSDENMTPENDSFGIEEPHITSSSKVAAQNRRRLSDSSSDTHPPTKKRGRPPKFRDKPDWTTKSISLNNHQAVVTSDPEDDDYDPDKNTQEMEDARMKSRPSRPGLLRMPTPEWERPDWEGPSAAPPTSSTRGKITTRRGVSGRAPLVDRDSARRRSSAHGNGDYVYLDSPQYWDDQSLISTQADLRPDPFEKPRDSQGRLIRQNGKIDGRSLRHERAREEKARQAAVQQQFQRTSQDSKHVTEGRQDEMQAMGLTAPGAGQSFVDALALQAARNPGVAGPAAAAPHQVSTTSNAIKQEKDLVDRNGEGGASTTAGVTAPRPQGDRHAALMKQMFPWR